MFRYEFLTLTQLGKLFGVSSHQVGRWLIQIGLRTPHKRPSKQAHDDGFCQQGPSRNDGYNWIWHAEKTINALQDAGHHLVVFPSTELLDPPHLVGPFSLRPWGSEGFEVVNSDGSISLWIFGAENARLLVRILNLAHDKGIIRKPTIVKHDSGES